MKVVQNNRDTPAAGVADISARIIKRLDSTRRLIVILLVIWSVWLITNVVGVVLQLVRQ